MDKWEKPVGAQRLEQAVDKLQNLLDGADVFNSSIKEERAQMHVLRMENANLKNREQKVKIRLDRLIETIVKNTEAQ